MNAATRLTAALLGLAVLATLGEGGGAVGALLLWHSIVLAIVLMFLLAPERRSALPRPHPWLWPTAAVFAGCAAIGALRAPYAYAAWLVVIELAAFTAVCLLAAASQGTWPRWLIPTLLSVAAAQGLYVLYQAAVLDRSRPAGTFLNTNHMSGWIVMVGLFAVPWWFSMGRSWRIGAAILALPAIGALLVSSSRGALLGAAVGGAWLVVTGWASMDRRVRTMVVAVAVLAGAAIGFRQVERAREDPFIHHRPLIWRNSLRVLADDPLWGSGPGQFPVAAARHRFEDGHGPLRFDRTFRATHSDWLRGPVEFGIPAGLGLAGLVTTFAVIVVRRRRRGPWTAYDDGALAALLALSTQALVDNPSRWPAAWLLAAFFAGRLAAVPAPTGAARTTWSVRVATAAVVSIVFLAVEVGPTMAWFGASAADADAHTLRVATRWSPGQPLYWSRLADRTLDSGTRETEPRYIERYGEAREYAENAVRLQPRDARFRLGLAEIEARACLARFRDTSCRARVLGHFAQAARRSPFDATIPLQAAEFASRAGDPAGARRLVDRALELEPNAVPARLLLAETLLAVDPARAGESRRLVDEAEALAARYSGVARKSGYARALLGFDAERAAAVRRRSEVLPSRANGRATEGPKALTYARGSRSGSATPRR